MEELPLLGLGHSLGALMQTLLYCQHAPYTEACAGLALVSWNNKPVSDAIPLFKELFVPALAPLEGPLEQAATATCQPQPKQGKVWGSATQACLITCK